MRLSQMLAVATIAALIAGVFATISTTNAATGDVSANRGYCVQTDTGAAAVYHVSTTTTLGSDSDLGDTDGTEVTVEVPDDGATNETPAGRDDDDDPDRIRVECNSAFAGQAVTVTPSGGPTPVVTLAAPVASVSLGDSDGIVAAGGADLTVRVSIRNLVQFTHNATLNEDDDAANDVAVTSTAVGDGAQAVAIGNPASFDTVGGAAVLWVRVSGELGDAATPTGGWASSTVSTTLPIPAGTTPGEYTISAAVIYDPNTDAAVTDDDRDGSSTDEDSTVLIATKTITVGDPGIDAASVSLWLGNASEDNPLTTKTTGAGEMIPEDGTEPADGGDVFLKVQAMNSLGKPSNDASLTTMTVIAPGGSISIYGPNARRTAPGAMVDGSTGSNSASITTAADVKNTMFVLVGKADRKPGTVDVYTLLIGRDGAPRSETVTLTFTGASTSLALGEAKPVAPSGKTEFTINALDAAGNSGAVGQLSFSVTDPDGKPVGQGENSKLSVTKNTAGSSTPDKETDDNALQTVGLVETMATTAPGVYTVKVSLAGVADSEAETTVTVSGDPANVSLEVSMSTDTVQLGTIITVVASVTDKNGAPVADENTIGFATGGSLTLDKVFASTKTKDGAGTGEFIVSKGDGLGVIIVTSGTGRATHTVSLAAAEEEADDPSLSHLSGTSGLVSYNGPQTSASELMSLLAGRANAIWLSNNGSWVLYSNVDGAMVPGSVDFTVTSGDVLYISN